MALQSGVFDEVWVSTDHAAIAAAATKAGARVHWRTDAACSIDTASTESVMADFARAHEGWELLVLIQATSPLTTAEHMINAMQAFRLNGAADSLVSVTRQHRFRWLETATGLTEAVNYTPNRRPRK